MPKIVVTQSTTDYFHRNTRIIVSEHVRGKTHRVYAVFPESFSLDGDFLQNVINRLVAELNVRIGV